MDNELKSGYAEEIFNEFFETFVSLFLTRDAEFSDYLENEEKINRAFKRATSYAYCRIIEAMETAKKERKDLIVEVTNTPEYRRSQIHIV